MLKVVQPANSIATNMVKLSSKVFNPKNSIAAKISTPNSLGDKFVKATAKVVNPNNSIMGKITGFTTKLFSK